MYRRRQDSSNLETKRFQRDILFKTLNKVEASPSKSGPGRFSFHRVVVKMLNHFSNKSMLRNCQVALDNSVTRFGEEHPSTADSYHLVGVTQHGLGDTTSTLQSKQRTYRLRF